MLNLTLNLKETLKKKMVCFPLSGDVFEYAFSPACLDHWCKFQSGLKMTFPAAPNEMEKTWGGRAFRIVKQVTMFMLSEGKIWEQSSALQKEFKKKRKKIIFVVCTPQIHQRFAVKHDIVFRPPLTNLALKKKKNVQRAEARTWKLPAYRQSMLWFIGILIVSGSNFCFRTFFFFFFLRVCCDIFQIPTRFFLLPRLLLEVTM